MRTIRQEIRERISEASNIFPALFRWCLGMIAVVFVTSVAQVSPTPTVPPEVLNKANKLAHDFSVGAIGKPPGVELQVVEKSRGKTPVGQVVAYQLISKSLPSGQSYVLTNLAINPQKAAKPKTVTVGSAGVILDEAGGPLEVLIQAAKGEPFRFGISSHDGQYQAVSSVVVPFPLRRSDAQCSLGVVLLMPDAEAVLLEGAGFQADSQIGLVIDSEGEKRESTVNADANGSFTSVIMPYRVNVQSGVTTINASGEGCRPSIEFKWGRGTYRVE